jgi:hypothetical protein
MEPSSNLLNDEQQYKQYKTNCDKPHPPPTADSASIFSVPSERTSMTTIGASNWSTRALYSDNSDDDSIDISDDDMSTRSSLSSISQYDWETTSLLEGDLDGIEFQARDSMELYSNASYSRYRFGCFGRRWTIKRSPKEFSWSMLIPKIKVIYEEVPCKTHGSDRVDMPKKRNVVRFQGRRPFSKFAVKFRNWVCTSKRGSKGNN